MAQTTTGHGSGAATPKNTTSTAESDRWQRALSRHETVSRPASSDELSTAISTDTASQLSAQTTTTVDAVGCFFTEYYNKNDSDDTIIKKPSSEKPKRLVDFFCVIGPSSTRRGCSVVDCYPKTRRNVEFPRHLPQFCFPNGYRASTSPQPPTLMTLVLTSGNGNRLYGSVLTLHEEATAEQLRMFDDSILPKKREPHQMVYLATCLVVLSHYPFFDVFRTFLRQLYRIYHSGTSPLPLERYIATFVRNVPLPSLRSRVHWECFTKDTTIDFELPAPNELPLVSYSYQPLFFTLSVSNMLVVWGTLLKEGHVVLVSKFHSLLTPVAEALLSLLYPLQWHGLYIPVLPSDMYDVMDAPIPFLLGISSSDLAKLRRPDGVVFVDLDNDVVHLGWDDNFQPATVPNFPDSDVLALKVELEELVDHLYLVPSSGIKGRITHGNDETMDNSARETYSLMTRMLDEKMAGSTCHRHFILSNAERAFWGEPEPLEQEDYIAIGNEKVTTAGMDKSLSSKATVVLTEPTFAKALQRRTRSFQVQTDRLLAYAGLTFANENPFLASDDYSLLDDTERVSIATKFYELDEDVDAEQLQAKGKKFSTLAVRQTFLNFFVTLLYKYKAFTTVDNKGHVTFDRESFLNDKALSGRYREGVETVLSTQMFERFLHELVQINNPRNKFPQICLFDEYIIRKKNQSTWMSNEPTPLLESQRWKVRKVLTPPVASNARVWSGSVYHYLSFPKLTETEFLYSAGYWNCWTCSLFLCWQG
jgi:DENN domain-containing protein 5